MNLSPTHLRRKEGLKYPELLIVLDNFETVLDAASMAKYRPNYMKIELTKVEQGVLQS
ncbi:hypothetical protein [Nostoc sp.]|uniref:hypothetical protein n=1 Tax=Nostoc sp. TaxID=1180 RepID=UPI002FF58717